MKVVISGSRSIIKSLPNEAIERINTIISLGAEILIGDAAGVDKLVQEYLKSLGYTKVLVCYRGNAPRNNLGFKSFRVGYTCTYIDRDKYMCGESDYGLAIWDGQSSGTKANINRVPTRVVLV